MASELPVPPYEHEYIGYADAAATAAYQKLIETHAHLVKAAVGRIECCLPEEVDRGAMVGQAIMALVDTAHRFPPGQFFEQQAKSAIWSGIIGWLGGQPWLRKRLRESADLLYEAYLKTGRSFEGACDSARMAAHLQVTEARLEQWLSEVAAYFTAWPRSFLGLDSPGSAHSLALAIANLPPSARLVVTLSHYEELTPKEIAAVLSVPVEQVNRTYAEAGLHLRALLADAI